MSILPRERVFVGLDYHQLSVQVCVLDDAGRVLHNANLANDAATIAAVARRYGQRVEAAIECCCGAANLAKQLRELGWSISLAHAGFVSRMKQNPDKTDFADARILADLVRVGYLPKVWLAPDEIVELRRLIRFRQQLVNDRRNVKLRIRGLLRDERMPVSTEGGQAWTKAWLRQLPGLPLPETARWILEQQLARLTDLDQRAARGRTPFAAAPRTRCGRATAFAAAGHRPDHGRDHARRDRRIRPLSQRQAIGQILRLESSQRVERRTTE